MKETEVWFQVFSVVQAILGITIGTQMRTVLVVDDNETLAYFTARNLQRKIPNCEVLIATSCDQAKNLMSRRIISVAIVDAKLPDGHGLELLKEIRAENNGVASVLISGEALGTKNLPDWVHFMSKPYEVEELIKVANMATSEGIKEDSGPSQMEIPLSDQEAKSMSAHRHEALNRLASLLIGLKAFAADLKSNREKPEELDRITDEYIDKLCQIVRDVSTLLAEGKKSR